MVQRLSSATGNERERAIKWYKDRLESLRDAEPFYLVCGDGCAVCPRYLARTEDELHEMAVFRDLSGIKGE